jgi:hypothetical protein
MLAIVVPAAFINMCFAMGIFIVYFFYSMTYFDTSVSYKVPRAMGGKGIIVSKIIDDDFNKKIDKLSETLDQKGKK